MNDKNSKSEDSKMSENATPKVTGIGGIFFKANNPKETKDWYAKNLGIQFTDWGSCSFESVDVNNPNVKNTLEWMPFKKDTDYFDPSKKEFMINYRVQNIEGLIENLKENEVTILDTLQIFDYGKFIHIMDEDGNKIELWEPIVEQE